MTIAEIRKLEAETADYLCKMMASRNGHKDTQSKKSESFTEAEKEDSAEISEDEESIDVFFDCWDQPQPDMHTRE